MSERARFTQDPTVLHSFVHHYEHAKSDALSSVRIEGKIKEIHPLLFSFQEGQSRSFKDYGATLTYNRGRNMIADIMFHTNFEPFLTQTITNKDISRHVVDSSGIFLVPSWTSNDWILHSTKPDAVNEMNRYSGLKIFFRNVRNISPWLGDKIYEQLSHSPKLENPLYKKAYLQGIFDMLNPPFLAYYDPAIAVGQEEERMRTKKLEVESLSKLKAAVESGKFAQDLEPVILPTREPTVDDLARYAYLKKRLQDKELFTGEDEQKDSLFPITAVENYGYMLLHEDSDSDLQSD
jgi:hypothetical protein